MGIVFITFQQILKGVCDSVRVWEPLLWKMFMGLDEKTMAGKTFKIMESTLYIES